MIIYKVNNAEYYLVNSMDDLKEYVNISRNDYIEEIDFDKYEWFGICHYKEFYNILLKTKDKHYQIKKDLRDDFDFYIYLSFNDWLNINDHYENGDCICATIESREGNK